MTDNQRKRITTREPDPIEGRERFLQWVGENIIAEGECWIWQGTVNRTIGVATHKNQAAHAYIFKNLHGLTEKDPKTLGRIYRTCRNSKCVNPDHCYIAQGPATKKAIKREKRLILEEQAADLAAKNDPHAELTTYKKILDNIKTEVRNEVRKEVKGLSGLVIEGVVAELLRIRFDEMIAEQVAKKGGGRR
jgi:hypothetical protein